MKKRYWALAGIFLYAIINNTGTKSDKDVAHSVATSQSTSQQSHYTPQQTPPVKTNAPQGTDEIPTQAEAFELRFIIGSRVAFRKGPSTSDGIIDRLDNGREVLLIKRSKDWSRVRDKLSQREGWIASRFLVEKYEAPEEKPRQEVSKSKELPKIAPKIPDSVIVQRIIAESLASYPSSCACPYNTDRGGRRCGKRSAYSKPGGYSPICFSQDVTSAMIDAYRRQ
ncbi:SH3 domain-containing protein [Agrobacterium sp. Azo12]|uniref:SH3 domain-containing protein n=1 Tax=Agrobacterium sp. Azo12 TaxID=3031129 RepID=UPI0023D807C0|nr:SH3 domain-containing protein [Agrobacterium sp. Azo12]MDO5897895.1 SH3 domain-containing protein [Agrobacterium sp. Azo12]